MEVVLGFAVGYWVGTRQGRDGLQRAMDSARAIWESPETKRTLREGLSAFEAVAPVIDKLQRGRGSSRAAIIGNVMDEILERRERRAARAA
jgi:hypothetical protein